MGRTLKLKISTVKCDGKQQSKRMNHAVSKSLDSGCSLMGISKIFICDGEMRCEMDKNSWEVLTCSAGKTCKI